MSTARSSFGVVRQCLRNPIQPVSVANSACARAWIHNTKRASPSSRYGVRDSSDRPSVYSYFSPTRRRFSVSMKHQHGHLTPPRPGEELRITFVDQQGELHTYKVAEGDNLLDIAQSEDLEMEGACGGSCACSTCHVIVEDSEFYDKMAEPDDDENDMLDLAFGLTETSRLGCQVKMSKELDGLVVRLPSMTRNLQKSDFEGKKKG